MLVQAARKEMEKQRQIEWENQQLQKMQQARQQEKEKLLKLKARNQTYTIELGTLNEKVKELSQKICDTRVSVTCVKTVIDGMRSTRDTQMSDMASLKARIKEQNAKLVQLSQEKAKLDSKYAKGDGLSQEIFAKKQMNINQLRGKLQNLKEEVEPKGADVNANTEQLNDVKIQLKGLLDNCEEIYALYITHRNQVNELKNNKKNDSLTYAWDAVPTVQQDSWSTATAVVSSTKNETTITKSGSTPYRAIYEFNARNTDEITFSPGDIIMVPFEQNAEPGWLAGEINGHTGWFPESYVEKIDNEIETVGETVSNYDQEVDTIADIQSPQNAISSSAQLESDDTETYISCYPYESTEIGDLTFGAGEYIIVTKKDGDWWTGNVGDRTGIFPSNYVQTQSATENSSHHAQQPQSQMIDEQTYSDDIRNQEEVDTEVSEINTQPNIDSVQDNYSRPMSTSSTTSVSILLFKFHTNVITIFFETKRPF